MAVKPSGARADGHYCITNHQAFIITQYGKPKHEFCSTAALGDPTATLLKIAVNIVAADFWEY